ncbi:hypothetical protein H9L39_07608 [Fusarium oxysporum f. sp. albedinis]|nr:hypothetical protein H9L39_07608 [Fusarium oxysporum f. sp. albedinis]
MPTKLLDVAIEHESRPFAIAITSGSECAKTLQRVRAEKASSSTSMRLDPCSLSQRYHPPSSSIASSPEI